MIFLDLLRFAIDLFFEGLRLFVFIGMLSLAVAIMGKAQETK